MNTWQKTIESAYQRLHNSPHAPYHTALELSAYFSKLTSAQVYFKQEHLQKTGSFKYRGALNKLLSLPPENLSKGVITASSGNHGLGCALAAKQLGIPITVYLPGNTSEAKLQGIRLLGANISTVAGDGLEAELSARQEAEDEQKIYIPPYNDTDIVAGQGTVGLEIIDQLPNVDAVFVAVGGGGLISGIGSYIKAIKPQTEIIACWPENAPAMHRCLEVGDIIEVEERETLSDGTAGGIEPGSITLSLCQQVIDKQVLVSERQISDALREFAQCERQIIEGAAAVALAAALKVAHDYRNKNIAVVLCGRNIALSKFVEVMR